MCDARLQCLRLFIVCHPAPPPPYALKDVFGRFGNLIDIYILNGKTCGYAKYACKESAEKAIQVSLDSGSPGGKGAVCREIRCMAVVSYVVCGRARN